MPSYNRVVLMGNLTRDPELRFTPNNTPVCRLGVAVNRRWRNQSGEMQEEVTFVDCDAWGRQAEVINQYFRKGKPILIEGRLKLDQWQDQQGQNHSKLKVVLEGFEFVGSKDDADGGGGGGGYGGQNAGYGGPGGGGYGQQPQSGYGGPPAGGQANTGGGYNPPPQSGGYTPPGGQSAGGGYAPPPAPGGSRGAGGPSPSGAPGGGGDASGGGDGGDDGPHQAIEEEDIPF